MRHQKVALVTGANKGIGFEIARQLAARDFLVYLGARDLLRGAAAVEQLERAGLAAEFIHLDVADAAGIEKASREIAGDVDHLDVLVNNAGIMEDGTDSILTLKPKLLWKTLETNTLGPLLLSQHLWPLLAKSDSGRIINISSGLGALHDMEATYPAYSISKTALNALTRQLAAALKNKNIAVNSVCPGWVRTDMGGPGATRSPEEGADTAIWLATEAPAGLTGQFLQDRKVVPW